MGELRIPKVRLEHQLQCIGIKQQRPIAVISRELGDSEESFVSALEYLGVSEGSVVLRDMG